MLDPGLGRIISPSASMGDWGPLCEVCECGEWIASGE